MATDVAVPSSSSAHRPSDVDATDARSAVTTMLEDARTQSTIVQSLTGLADRVEAAVRRSRVVSLVRSSPRLEAAISQSRIAAIGRTCHRYVTASWCYRWLTAEPDPDVVVIDLRETKTVGPIIAGGDRLATALQRATPSSTVVNGTADAATTVRDRPLGAAGLVVLSATATSLGSLALGGALSTPALLGHLFVAGLAALGLRSNSSLEDLRETKPARILAAAFEPPEPPDANPELQPQQPEAPDSRSGTDEQRRGGGAPKRNLEDSVSTSTSASTSASGDE